MNELNVSTQHQVTSRGCSRGFILCVCYRSLHYVSKEYAKGCVINFPFDTNEVYSWLRFARTDCVDLDFQKQLGGTHINSNDQSTYWTHPQQFFTWWKNNVERKSKHASLKKDASYFGDDIKLKARSTFCRNAIAISMNIKNYFERNIALNGGLIVQVDVPFTMPSHMPQPIYDNMKIFRCQRPSSAYDPLSLETNNINELSSNFAISSYQSVPMISEADILRNEHDDDDDEIIGIFSSNNLQLPIQITPNQRHHYEPLHNMFSSIHLKHSTESYYPTFDDLVPVSESRLGGQQLGVMLNQNIRNNHKLIREKRPYVKRSRNPDDETMPKKRGRKRKELTSTSFENSLGNELTPREGDESTTFRQDFDFVPETLDWDLDWEIDLNPLDTNISTKDMNNKPLNGELVHPKEVAVMWYNFDCSGGLEGQDQSSLSISNSTSETYLHFDHNANQHEYQNRDKNNQKDGCNWEDSIFHDNCNDDSSLDSYRQFRNHIQASEDSFWLRSLDPPSSMYTGMDLDII